MRMYQKKKRTQNSKIKKTGKGVNQKTKSKYQPLTNFDVDDILGKYPHYKGVFPKDMIPKKISKKEMGVINLDDSSGVGTHWVGYFNSPENKYVYYFDSFGLAPPEEVKKFLKSSGKDIQFSTSHIQDIDSVMCGYYVVYVLKELSKGKDFYDVIYTFDPFPSKDNESDIKEIAERLI